MRYRLPLYLTGAAAARIGDEMSGPALLLAGLAVTGSAATGSLLLSGIMISAAIGGPVLGALLDRTAVPGRLLTGALAGYAAVLIVVLLGLGRLPLPAVVAVAVLGGLLGPALAGGWTSQLARLVGPDRLPRATALDAMTYNLGSLAGPALAGAVALVAGATAGVITAAALILLALPAAWTLPTVPERRGPAPRTSVAADLAAGFLAIVRARFLARATVTSVISYVGVGILVTCTPLLGEKALGSTDSGAFLLATLAAASLAANALVAKRFDMLRPDTTVLVSTLVLAGALLLAAAASPIPLFTAMVLAGIGAGPQLTALFAVRHREAPERLRGQIFTTGASLKITGFAIGAGIGGPLATWSLSGSLIVAAGFEVLASAAFLAYTAAGSGRRPRPADTALPQGRETAVAPHGGADQSAQERGDHLGGR
ncbi:putative MFS family arabinose efflux permease [Murinocardiopsis flavida]|uniref:Putative MFS family arabinose efflux permease n=2 Tax=Murinocardiopsis flavida TaxID=645275 RepID=A0A2P8CR77_9ACTN|nr:putative MFS family arabinose efflux permease [Murinocardiopsis flavida]